MVDLAKLVVRLVADTARFQQEIDRASREVGGFKKLAKDALKTVGIAAGAAALGAATAFAAMAKAAIDAADGLNAMSKSTGVSTESLSQLQYAAEQSATDLDGLAAGLKKLATQATEAATKAGSARDAFKLIGVSATDAAGKIKPTEQLLLDIAEQFAKYQDGPAKAAAAIAIFGQSGAALVPLLNNGRVGIEELMQEADKLGITLSAKTAQAADDFNSQLNQMRRQVDGVTLQLTAQMLPGLVRIVTALADFLKEGNAVRGMLDGLATAFKAILYVGISVADLFGDIGRLIGAAFAAREALLQGHVTRALQIVAEAHADGVAAEERTSKLLNAIWDDRAAKYNASLEKYSRGPSSRNRGNRIAQGIPEGKPAFPVAVAAVSRVQEVDIKLKKIDLAPIDELYDELNEKTKTRLERTLAGYAELKVANKTLLDAEKINLETYNARLKEIQTNLLLALSQEPIKKATKELNEYQLQAARNTQDIIADTFEQLVTGGEVSAKSILKSFGSMIVKLAAQAAAANLAGKLFGEAGGGTKGSSGWVGLALGALGFGGKRDAGGRGTPGMAYAIGTGAQPELFIPDRSGTFVPAGAGGVMVTNNFNIQGGEPISRRTQMQIAAAASRGVERANRRNN